MSPSDALYRAVCAAPHDDLPRLVYADWLEENGRAERAEFIRVQCRLANASPADDDYVDLLEREAELKAILWRELDADRPALPAGIGWEPEHRGFAERLRFGDQFSHPFTPVIDQLAGVNAGVPVAGLRSIWMDAADVKRLSASPLAATLTSFHTGGPSNGDAGREFVSSLANGDCFPHLRRLAIDFHLDRLLSRVLTESPTARRLRELRLSDNADLWLSTPPVGGAALHLLHLGGSNMLGSLEQADADWFVHTHTLLGVRVTVGGRVPFSWLSDFPRLVALELLDLPPDLSPLLGAVSGPLRSLDIHAGRMSALHHRLDADTRLTSLRVLGLPRARLECALALLLSGHLVELRQLDLRAGGAAGHQIDALSKAPVWRSLTAFDWSGGPQGPKAFARLLGSVDAPNLKHLNMSGTPLGDAGAVALSNNASLANLTRLNLSACGIGPAGVEALLNSPHLQGLIELNLYANQGGEALAPLADAGVMPNLGLADVAANGVSGDLRRRLENRPAVRAR